MKRKMKQLGRNISKNIKRNVKKIKHTSSSPQLGPEYEFCTRCDANLTLQKGYRNDLAYWVCTGCGQMLINPEFETEDDIIWRCDGCGDLLNIQPGFTDNDGIWNCTKCGYANKIDASEVYAFEAEYDASLSDPYKGLSDEAVLELSLYSEIKTTGERNDIILVESSEDNKRYVKKYVKDYDLSVYRFLYENPIDYIPRIVGLYEGTNNLVIIEEYIEGRTLSEILKDGALSQDKAVSIAIRICKVLSELHGLESPIVHRDIKPSNIIFKPDGDVYLIDMNVAKWFSEEKVEDTMLFGTLYYAAPEQFGYGFKASSGKSDIYSVGMMLNEMITGKLPKEEKASGPIWNIIERCISMEPERRYTADELMEALGRLVEDMEI